MSEALHVGEKIYKGLARILRGRHNVDAHDRKLNRAIRDHLTWLKERDSALTEELSKIASHFASNGAFHSGPRVAAQDKAKSEAIQALQKHRIALTDLREDLQAEETFIERFHRRKRPMLSVEPSAEEEHIVNQWRKSDPSV